PSGGADVFAATSADQVVAHELRKFTQLPSIELGIESGDVVGVCASAFYSCAYHNTISWLNPTTPLPTENQPRVVFERVFGDRDSSAPVVQRTRIQERRSVLDFISSDVDRLMKTLGPSDRTKVSQYIEAVRDIERRIEIIEQSSRASTRQEVALERPVGI